MISLTDTHCHIHEGRYPYKAEEVIKRANEAGVNRFICVGTDGHTSAEAVRYATGRPDCWASVGLHPHDAKEGPEGLKRIKELLERQEPKIIAIGECGLDYFYDNSPRELQKEILRGQLNLAQEYDLPLIFHVRDAFDDFWAILEQYPDVRGVIHSFTDSLANLQTATDKGLYIGVNGISTFTSIDEQKEMFNNIPMGRMLLETDSPFLTPKPYRGKVNEPAFVLHVATHMADLHNVTLEELSAATSKNATTLFTFNQ